MCSRVETNQVFSNSNLDFRQVLTVGGSRRVGGCVCFQK